MQLDQPNVHAWVPRTSLVFSSIHRRLNATRRPTRWSLTCFYCGAIGVCARYRGDVAMRLTRSADEACFVGHWNDGDNDFLAHLSAGIIDGVQLPAPPPGIASGPVQHTCYLFISLFTYMIRPRPVSK